MTPGYEITVVKLAYQWHLDMK